MNFIYCTPLGRVNIERFILGNFGAYYHLAIFIITINDNNEPKLRFDEFKRYLEKVNIHLDFDLIAN